MDGEAVEGEGEEEVRKLTWIKTGAVQLIRGIVSGQCYMGHFLIKFGYTG